LDTGLLNLRSIFIFSVLCCFSNENGTVTAALQGQLGNQMFQVATAVAYGLDHQCSPIFWHIRNGMGGEDNAAYIFHRLDRTAVPEDSLVYYHENQHTHYTIYAPIPFEKGRNLIIMGGFQCPKYFEHRADYIRALFAPSEGMRKAIQAEYAELLQHPTVALHVRTFIPDGRDPNHSIGQRGWAYFLQAMSYFSKEHIFLIFSDHMGWVKENFPQNTGYKIYFVEGNPYWIDFYLMSFCNHQIISSESTFSWWAAWMNLNPHKKVIAPDIWASRYDAEIIPPEWVKIHY
jgi:hypothetical protein